MNQKFIKCLIAAAGAILLTATNGFSYGDYGTTVNNACAPAVPYVNDCSLCHLSDRGAPTPAKTAYAAGGTTQTDFFCPPTLPTCTDNDNDSYAVEGGDCGPVDCDDTNAAINPGTAENCNDNIDNNCNGLVDVLDPAAVGCLVCTDNDGDTFAVEGGDCGLIDCNDSNAAINPAITDIPNNGIDEDCSGTDSVDPTALDKDGDSYSEIAGDCNDSDATINPSAFDIPNNGIDEDCDGVDSIDSTTVDNDGDGFTPETGDCNDTDGTINPDAVENCTDTIDNNCNGLIDSQDPNAADCPLNCTDNDGDSYSIDGNECGPVDCNDNEGTINPSAQEVCADNIDNDCDGSIDEGCDTTCPDIDDDGFTDASCGGDDCNDNDATINPGSAEVCGNAVDENCNGASDDTCLTCPDGTLLVIKELEYNKGDKKIKIKGRATVGTTLSITNSDTEEILLEGIRVKKGKWEAEIKQIDSTLENISVISSNGCAVDKAIKSGNHDNRDEDDDEDFDKEKRKKHSGWIRR